jgi:developmental checkpoint coupling sporulation initiation to replication initiation
MKEQTDEFIVEAYEKALELNLEPDFLLLLEKELERRELAIHREKVC